MGINGLRLAACGLAIVFLGITGNAQPAQPTNYVVGAQDILTITSFDQQDLTGKYPVDSDGTFTFPLIGRVKAGGLTLRQLEAELKRLLMDGFFKDPQLSVGVETYKSQKIHIVGEVRNPGTYSLPGPPFLAGRATIRGLGIFGGARRESRGERNDRARDQGTGTGAVLERPLLTCD